MQNIDRHHHWDGDRPRNIGNFVDLEAIPEDVRTNVLNEFVVKVTCQHCHFEHHYISLHTTNEVECKTADCDNEIVIP